MNSNWRDTVSEPREQYLKRLAQIVYILQAASFLTSFVTLFAGVIINYVRREDVAGTWLESHFRWQTRTFWYTALWTFIGGLLTIVLFGWAILTATALWLIYRIVKGWIYLSEQRAMPS